MKTYNQNFTIKKKKIRSEIVRKIVCDWIYSVQRWSRDPQVSNQQVNKQIS